MMHAKLTIPDDVHERWKLFCELRGRRMGDYAAELLEREIICASNAWAPSATHRAALSVAPEPLSPTKATGECRGCHDGMSSNPETLGQVLVDLHHAIGTHWGENPYLAIERLCSPAKTEPPASARPDLGCLLGPCVEACYGGGCEGERRIKARAERRKPACVQPTVRPRLGPDPYTLPPFWKQPGYKPPAPRQPRAVVMLSVAAGVAGLDQVLQVLGGKA